MTRESNPTVNPAVNEDEPQAPSWTDKVVSFTQELAQPHFNRGERARLRRMDHQNPNEAVFWRLLASRDLLGESNMGHELETKWALILKGIAIMTPTVSDKPAPGAYRRSAHNPTIGLGQALYCGGETRRLRAFYSELRLDRLLKSHGAPLQANILHTCRMLGPTRPFNWRHMARLILNDGYREDRADLIRRQIASDYQRSALGAQRAARSAEPTD